MSDFRASDPVVYKDKNNKKWCVRYSLTIDGITTYLKEYGKSYGIQLNSIKNLSEREIKLNLLLSLVKADLDSRILPVEKERYEEELRIKRKEESLMFHFDEVLALVLKTNYGSQLPNQNHSRRNLTNFWRNQFKPFLEKIGKVADIREVAQNDIKAFIEGYTTRTETINKKAGETVVRAVWSNRTARNRIDWLAIFFQPLVAARKLEINPCHNIRLKNTIDEDDLGTKLVRFQIFTRNELDILWSYLEAENYYHFTFAKTLYYTFIRISEMLRLRLWMVDLNNNRILIPPSIAKNGRFTKRPQEIYVYPKLKNIIEHHINLTYGTERRPDYLLFPSHKSGTNQILPLAPRRSNKIADIFGRHFKKLRIQHSGYFAENKTLYSLKHSGNTHFIENNFKNQNKTALQILTFLRKQNRHATLNQTQVYISEDLGIMLDEDSKGFIFD